MARPINYTSREFALILEDIRANARAELPDVNDFLESNEGRFLFDQWAAIGDMLGFTIDRQGAESFVDTVETRANMVGLLKMIGYNVQNPTPETVTVTLTRVSSDIEIVVPKYTPMLASTGIQVVPFVTSNAVTFNTGSTTVSVGAVQGQWTSASFTSNGSAHQSFVLSSSNIAHGMVRVFVSGNEWTQAVDNTFVGHVAADTVFSYNNMTDRRVRVNLGNGGEGFIPPRGETIKIDYFITLHVGGHIDANQMVALDTQVLDASPSNAEPSAGGRDYETLDSARFRYPTAFKAMRRAVTLGDWEALAQIVPGVLQAHAVDINRDSALPFFKVRIYVVGNGGIVSDALNKAVDTELRGRKVNATVFDVLSPAVSEVDVVGTVDTKRTHDADTVISDATNAVQNFFVMSGEADSEIKVGEDVSFSRLISAIQAVDGVSSVNLTSPLTDIPIGENEFARLKTVNLTAGDVV
jgi:phage-related baseplate assembly protein